MRIQAKFAIAVLLCGASTCLSLAQEGNYGQPKTSNADVQNTGSQSRDSDRTLNEDDRLSLLAAALDARVRRSERDCSHLVHAIYQQAGFAYRYAPSSEIYAGIEGFQRIKQPQPGDLVVWRGHVGIVIKPSQHIFFSLMRSGPGTDDYEAAYWKGRGRPRFYRYVKSDFCAGCDSVRPGSRRLVKIKR